MDAGRRVGRKAYIEIENCKQAIRFKLKPNDITAEQTAVQCSAGDMIMTEDGHPVVIEDQYEIED